MWASNSATRMSCGEERTQALMVLRYSHHCTLKTRWKQSEYPTVGDVVTKFGLSASVEHSLDLISYPKNKDQMYDPCDHTLQNLYIWTQKSERSLPSERRLEAYIFGVTYEDCRISHTYTFATWYKWPLI